MEEKSPYYYLIIGNTESIIWMRNKICILLEHNNSYVEEIEAGMDYKSLSYDFGIPVGAIRLVNQPTFYGVEDSCRIPLTIDITHYRWILADKDVFKECFNISSTMGSTVEVSDIKIEDDHQSDKTLNRKATASLTIKVSNMAVQSDVIEWTIAMPEEKVDSRFGNFLTAKSQNDLTRTFSMGDFIEGMFKGSKNIWQEEPNRILVSKESD